MTLIICPTYRERDNLEALTTAIWVAVPPAHLLLVDDASGDGTPAWARAHPGHGQTLHLLERPEKAGLGTAYREGFAWALERAYSFIVQMDADLTHDPADIPRLLAEARRGADLVLATRDQGEESADATGGRRALSRAGALIARRLLGLPMSDPMGGFKCWRREALLRLDLGHLSTRGFAFQIETNFRAWRLGLEVVEVPVRVDERRAGTSKLDGAIVGEALWTLVRLARERKHSDEASQTSPAR